MKINSKIHFIGISGIGMSGIAELMLDKGYSIQGSDISVNDNTKRLKKKGIKFFSLKIYFAICVIFQFSFRFYDLAKMVPWPLHFSRQANY